MPGPSIPALLERLASPEQNASRAAGEALLRLGEPARGPLLGALATGPEATRKAAAFLLGRLTAEGETTAALARALGDPEPKVRKNAALSLGRLEDARAVPALARALAAETVDWVRPTLVLALGRLEGGAAQLTGLQPSSALEAEALRKALDRQKLEPASARYRLPSSETPPVGGLVAPGLEDVALEEAREAGLEASVEPGRLAFAAGIHPLDLLPRLRCLERVALLLGQTPSLPAPASQDFGPALGRWLESLEALGGFRSWLEVDATELAYRFEITGARLARASFLDALARARPALRGLGWVDSPSNYAVTLRLELGAGAARLWLLPSFEPDGRFGYRLADVGAALAPATAACLARLVRRGEKGRVIDPTCGSGTLLVERAFLSPGLELLGFDVSPTAVAAARANVQAAGLEARIEIARGDAGDPRSWRSCSEVLANLPFGLRSARQDRDLARLYERLAANLGEHLEGRALLYTSARGLLDRALEQQGKKLKVVARREVRSGGMAVGLWTFEALRPPPARRGA
ncbi:MAG: HEAT repeat domain-containing protein [Thermoanaerobaculia bacterium]